MQADLTFYKYNDNSCVQFKSYSVRYLVDANHRKEINIKDDGDLQVVQNGEKFFDVRISTLTEAGFQLMHNF